MLRPSIIVAALAALLAIAACGGDDNAASDKKAVTAAAGDVKRYCALTRELDAAGEKFFAELGEDARPEEFEAAERRFIERSAGELQELERVVPRETRADVRKVLAAMRERAGLETAVDLDRAEASAAEKRVRAYEKRSCGA